HAETDLARRRAARAPGQCAALFRFGARRASSQGRVDRRGERRIDGGLLPVLEDGLQPVARPALSRLGARGAAPRGERRNRPAAGWLFVAPQIVADIPGADAGYREFVPGKLRRLFSRATAPVADARSQGPGGRARSVYGGAPLLRARRCDDHT